MRRRRHAFTLVELLVVTAIISVLIAMLMPVMFRVRASARTLKCSSNLRQIGMAFAAYRTDWRNYLPPVNAYVSDGPADYSTTPPTYADWSCPKGYGMMGALGAYVGYPEFGGFKDPTGVSPTPDPDKYTGYAKPSFDIRNTQGKKYLKSVFHCPETATYVAGGPGPMPGSGYGESLYLQKYPCGSGKYNVPSTGARPGGGGFGYTSSFCLPRPASAIKDPATAIAVSERCGDGHSTSGKTLPDIRDVIPANYPPSDHGPSPNLGGSYSTYGFDMYRHNGGCNVLFADGHVAYYKGVDILTGITRDPVDVANNTDKSPNNYHLP